MTAIQSHVYIDWDYELGDVVDFTTSGDDITVYRQRVQIRSGRQPGTRIARVGTCNITVLNDERIFSPRHTGSPYYGKLLPMKPVKVTAGDGMYTETMFVGWIKAIKPAPNKYGERRAVIECVDHMGMVQQSNIDIPLRENVRSDQLVLDVLNYALKAPAATGRYAFVLVPADGDTATINGTVYRFKSTLVQANDVKIGTGASARYDTIIAWVSAINGWDGEGTLYYAGTARPSGVRARYVRSYYQIIHEDDPVRYHRLGETSGTTINDLGSNRMNATVSGSPTMAVTGAVAADAFDGALRFDGSNDVVSLTTLDLSNRSFSVEFWFKPASSPPVNQDLFSAHTDFANNKSFYIRYNDGAHGVVSGYWYGLSQVDSGVLVAGTWYHFVLVYDASIATLTLYQDGVAVGSTTGGPFIGTSPTLEIGAYTSAGGNYTKGDIDEFALYLRMLSEEEIAEHHSAATTASYPGVTIYSLLRGAIGNSYTLAVNVPSGNVAVTGATLTGGVDTPNMATDIQTGLRTFPYAGDDWEGEKTSAYTALQAIADSERGQIYVRRDGTFVFENYAKEFTAITATPVLETDGTGNEVVIDLDGEMSSDDVINAVTVRFTPRSDTATGVVAKINSPIKVPGRWGEQSSDPNRDKTWYANGRPVGDPGQIVVNLPFIDQDTGQRIGAKELVTPLVAATDWTANEAADGSLVDYTTYLPQQLFFSLAPKASSVDVSIKNAALGTLYVRTLQVRGKLIKRHDAQTVVREDVNSIALYGRKAKQFTLALEADTNFATAIAEYELSRVSDPIWRPKTVSWRNIEMDAAGNKVLEAEIGSAMLLHEYQAMDDDDQVQVRICGASYKFELKNEFMVTHDIEIVDDRIFGIYDSAVALYDQCNYTI